MCLIFPRGGKARWDPRLTHPHLYVAVCTTSRNPPTEERGATARRGRGLGPAQIASLCLQHGPPGGLGTVSVCRAPSSLCPQLSPSWWRLRIARNLLSAHCSSLSFLSLWAWPEAGKLQALPGAHTSRCVQPGLIHTAIVVKPREVSVLCKERPMGAKIVNTFLHRRMLLSQVSEQ